MTCLNEKSPCLFKNIDIYVVYNINVYITLNLCCVRGRAVFSAFSAYMLQRFRKLAQCNN